MAYRMRSDGSRFYSMERWAMDLPLEKVDRNNTSLPPLPSILPTFSILCLEEHPLCTHLPNTKKLSSEDPSLLNFLESRFLKSTTYLISFLLLRDYAMFAKISSGDKPNSCRSKCFLSHRTRKLEAGKREEEEEEKEKKIRCTRCQYKSLRRKKKPTSYLIISTIVDITFSHDCGSHNSRYHFHINLSYSEVLLSSFI